MLDSIYIGMSGLTSFSKGLSNISSNVANLNTTGYKGSELQFNDLFYKYQYAGSNQSQSNILAQGSGVKAGTTSLNFTQGDFRQTGNDLDAAINGNGFFVLKKDNETFYTRAGQFVLDNNGFLTTRDNDARVMAFTNGGLNDINISGSRSTPPKATTEVKFTNTLSVGSPTFELTNISVFDSLGQQRQLTLNLVNDSTNSPGRWTFKVLEGTAELSAGEIKFDSSGNAIAGKDKYSFTYSPKGAASTRLTLDFKATNYLSSSSSTLRVDKQNGLAAGFLTKAAIDVDGFLVLTYSNGATVKNSQLALANFDNLSALQSQGGNKFSQFGDAKRIVGTPSTFSLGKLRVSGIELSNVDLAREFSELIVVQRAYQASSQVISAANEMIQQLGEIRGRR
jgi:flagellar hook protein FlgE